MNIDYQALLRFFLRVMPWIRCILSRELLFQLTRKVEVRDCAGSEIIRSEALILMPAPLIGDEVQGISIRNNGTMWSYAGLKLVKFERAHVYKEFIVDRHGLAVRETFYDEDIPYERLRGGLGYRRNEVYVAEPAYAMLHPCPGNYWHFMIEILPGLIYALKSGLLVQKVIGKFTLPYQFEILRELGFDRDRLIIIQDEDSVACAQVFTAINGHSRRSLPHAVRWLRNHYLGSAQVQWTGRERLFIKRGSQAARYHQQEELIADKFEKQGFSIVQSESLTFREQVELFSRAGVIAGLHGAGLTNGVFAPRGTKILEIGVLGHLSDDHIWTNFVCGHSIWSFRSYAREAWSGERTEDVVLHEPYEIDLHSVEVYLEKVLSSDAK